MNQNIKKQHEFWDKQPVSGGINQFDETENNSPIEIYNDFSSVPTVPYNLPNEFFWKTLDVNDTNQLEELYTFLSKNYYDNSENLIYLNYSSSFLKWYLTCPDYNNDWYICICLKSTNKIVGFISGIPTNIIINSKEIKAVKINFLCVHKKLRNKRMSPVLIQEIIRRIKLFGISQAIYTGINLLNKPIGTSKYWLRLINIKKIIESNCFQIPKKLTHKQAYRLYDLPTNPTIDGIRLLERKDLKIIKQLLNAYLNKFYLSTIFNDEEIEHWCLPRDEIIYSYVVENEDKEIIGFFSFYFLSFTILKNSIHKSLKVAYSFYNYIKDNCGITLSELIHNALIISKTKGCDLFQVLDLMDNMEFLEKEKFIKGSIDLHYYLFNWKYSTIEPKNIGIILQ